MRTEPYQLLHEDYEQFQARLRKLREAQEAQNIPLASSEDDGASLLNTVIATEVIEDLASGAASAIDFGSSSSDASSDFAGGGGDFGGGGGSDGSF